MEQHHPPMRAALSEDAHVDTSDSPRRQEPPSHPVNPKKRHHPLQPGDSPTRKKIQGRSRPKAHDLSNFRSLGTSSIFTKRPLYQVEQDFEQTTRRGEALDQLFTDNPADVTKKDFHNACKAFPRNAVKSELRDGRLLWHLEGMKDCVLEHHQLLGSGRMRTLEKGISGKPRGGMLADAMGLGKTITSLACVIGDLLEISRQKSIDPPKGESVANEVTLIVVPNQALRAQWEEEIKSKCDESLFKGTLCWSRGSSLASHILQLLPMNRFMITTYDEVRMSYPSEEDVFGNENGNPEDMLEYFELAKSLEDRKGLLHKLRFRRIILDEAHHIKNPDSRRSKACRALDADYRWALSGTPMQNGAYETYSYLDFLRVGNMSKRAFNKAYDGSKGYAELKRLVDPFLIRRDYATTIFDRPIVNIPNNNQRLALVQFGRVERLIYNTVQVSVINKIAKIRKEEKDPERRRKRIVMEFLRLRQLVSHFLVGSHFLPSFATGDEQLKQLVHESKVHRLTDLEVGKVVRCITKIAVTAKLQLQVQIKARKAKLERDIEVLEKTHLGSHSSLERERRSLETKAMNKPFRIDKFRVKAFMKEGGQLLYSPKTKEVVRLVRQWQEDHPSEKIIVFSQFLQTIGILKRLLDFEGIPSRTYTGEQSHSSRAKNKQSWATDKSCPVLLMTLQSGGEGLNLTEGSRVIILDLWWNSAAEEQAFARVYRIGQERATELVRIVLSGSFDLRLLEIQERKEHEIQAVMEGKASRVSPLSIDEMSELLTIEENYGADDDDKDIRDVDEDSDGSKRIPSRRAHLSENPTLSDIELSDDSDSESDSDSDEGDSKWFSQSVSSLPGRTGPPSALEGSGHNDTLSDISSIELSHGDSTEHATGLKLTLDGGEEVEDRYPEQDDIGSSLREWADIDVVAPIWALESPKPTLPPDVFDQAQRPEEYANLPTDYTSFKVSDRANTLPPPPYAHVEDIMDDFDTPPRLKYSEDDWDFVEFT